MIRMMKNKTETRKAVILFISMFVFVLLGKYVFDNISAGIVFGSAMGLGLSNLLVKKSR